MIELVIKIHEKDYQILKSGQIPSSVLDVIPISVLDVLMKGIPLPKHHGRLIDADALIFNADYYEPLISKRDVDFAPTIIEADKENADEEN